MFSSSRLEQEEIASGMSERWQDLRMQHGRQTCRAQPDQPENRMMHVREIQNNKSSCESRRICGEDAPELDRLTTAGEQKMRCS